MKEYSKRTRGKQAGKWLQNQANQVKGLLWFSAGAGMMASLCMVLQCFLLANLLVALLLAATAPLIPFFMHLVGNEAAHAGRRQFQALSLLADRIQTLLQGLHVLRMAFLSSAVLEFLLPWPSHLWRFTWAWAFWDMYPGPDRPGPGVHPGGTAASQRGGRHPR
ncbi:MAG: hypothetical protein ABR534_10210 [Desulfotignum sp.]|nr:hypothetical protein [Desulfobacteraceae bacterium]